MGVLQVLTPGIEVDVCHHRRRTLAPPVDDLVQQIGGVRAFATFDPVKGKLSRSRCSWRQDRQGLLNACSPQIMT